MAAKVSEHEEATINQSTEDTQVVSATSAPANSSATIEASDDPLITYQTTHLDAIDALARLRGNTALLLQLLTNFRRDWRQALIDLEQSSGTAAEDFRRYAHTLKGAGGNRGLLSVQAAAKACELAADNPATHQALMHTLADNCTATDAELDDLGIMVPETATDESNLTPAEPLPSEALQAIAEAAAIGDLQGCWSRTTPRIGDSPYSHPCSPSWIRCMPGLR